MSQKLNKPTITNYIEQVQARIAFIVHEPVKCQAVEPELRFEKSVWTVCAFQKYVVYWTVYLFIYLHFQGFICVSDFETLVTTMLK